jgi:hypothetical protein
MMIMNELENDEEKLIYRELMKEGNGNGNDISVEVLLKKLESVGFPLI